MSQSNIDIDMLLEAAESIERSGEIYFPTHLRRLVARVHELEAAASPPAWQGMETLPPEILRDRTYVLLRKPSWYSPPPAFVSRWKDTGLTAGWDGYYGPDPTHWMPLPAPPRSEAG